MACIRRRDKKMGDAGEKYVFKLLKEIYDNVWRTKKYALYDFETPNIQFELKTRNCKSTTYNTTIIPMNKIKKRNKKKELVFIFKFKDGIFCWDFDEDEYEEDLGGRTDRGCNEIKQYAYIPVKYLYPFP